MSKTYSCTQEELLVLIGEIKSRVGDVYKLKMIKIDQQNTYQIAVSKMTIDSTYALLRRIPRDYDNPDGIQRALKESKVDNIVRIASEDSQRYSSPNAVVLTLLTSFEYVSVDTHPEDDEFIYYVVDLNKFEKVISEAELDGEGYLIDESIFPGILIDGHHRSVGLHEAGKLLFECPITVYIDLPSQDTAKVFSDINIYQEKPSTVHSLAMKAIAGTLTNREEAAHNIVTFLNQEEWSVLHQRVKDIDGKRPKNLPKPYVTNSTFVKLIETQVLNHLPQDFPLPRKARLMNDYFLAWSEVYPEAWADEKTHVLVKSMGFQIMLRLFREIFTRTSLTQIPSKVEFENFLEEYMNPEEKLVVHGKYLDMNWNSPDFGGFSSGKGINDITIALTQHIANKQFQNQN